MKKTFDALTMKKMDNDSKIGILAVMGNDGYPHAAFINTIMPINENTLVWSQFLQGLTKRLLPEQKNAAFLALTPEKDVFRGKAVYDHEETDGEIFDLYNSRPRFRYNSYFGIEKVHIMDLKYILEPEVLKTGDIIKGAVSSRLAAGSLKNTGNIMNSITCFLFGQMDSLKFIVYEDNDGFPWIIPCIQAVPGGKGSIVFSLKPYGEELKKIPQGVKVAIYCANMKLQCVMVKGTFKGIDKKRGVTCGVIDVEKVYNPLPPTPGYIYPKEPIKKITEF